MVSIRVAEAELVVKRADDAVLFAVPKFRHSQAHPRHVRSALLVVFAGFPVFKHRSDDQNTGAKPQTTTASNDAGDHQGAWQGKGGVPTGRRSEREATPRC